VGEENSQRGGGGQFWWSEEKRRNPRNLIFDLFQTTPTKYSLVPSPKQLPHQHPPFPQLPRPAPLFFVPTHARPPHIFLSQPATIQPLSHDLILPARNLSAKTASILLPFRCTSICPAAAPSHRTQVGRPPLTSASSSTSSTTTDLPSSAQIGLHRSPSPLPAEKQTRGQIRKGKRKLKSTACCVSSFAGNGGCHRRREK
jgi:hypothetical protein